MRRLPHMGEVLRFHARILPDKIGACDLDPAMTFRKWNARPCQLGMHSSDWDSPRANPSEFKSAGKLWIAYIHGMLALRIAT